jgi:predicted Zn-dependent peptidase
MDEGTDAMTALEINERLNLLGASIGTGSNLDRSFVTLNTLIPALDASLDLYADIILNPIFPESEFDRLKKEQLVDIQREKATPIQMALRVMPKFLYGEGHAYNMPMTGSGYEETVQAISRNDVLQFYKNWISPNNATLVVVGDITMQDLSNKLESRFGAWQKGDTPKKQLTTVPDEEGNILYLLDRPESQQSVVIAGYVTHPYGDVNEIARQSMNNVLGGQFISRLNMNLREDKHWAYGAGSFIPDARGQRPYIAFAPVQTDKTSESVLEIKKEFEQFIGIKPVTQEEFEKDKANTVLQIPGLWETNNAVAGSILESVSYDLPDDYWQNYGKNVKNLKLGDIHNVAEKMVEPSKLKWFIVGDKEKILPGLQKLGFTEIIQVDPDGNPVSKIPVGSKP